MGDSGKTKTELRQNRVFRRIEKDIKDKNRKRRTAVAQGQGDRDELYVDKDRAIAVGHGAEDLKGHIMKHRGEMMRTTKTGEPEGHSLTTLVEQASHELRHGDPEKALSYLLRGLRFRPDSTECIILKCRCLLHMYRCREALENADLLIKQYKEGSNPEVLTLKGDALYFLGGFEHALVNYYRALRCVSSKEKGTLMQRVLQTKLAVSNAIGSSRVIANLVAGSTTEQLQDMIQAADKTIAYTEGQHKSLLSEISTDWEFLAKLDSKLSASPYTGTFGSRGVVKEAKEATDFLRSRMDFWMQHTLSTKG